MFGKKKKTTYNDVFGTMNYWGVQWESIAKITITLWNKKHEISLSAVAKSQKDGISEIQQNVYRDFKEAIIKRQKEIEKILEDYYKTQDEQTLISKFTPTELQISAKGECAILADNSDDNDSHDPPPGLAVVISPKAAVFTQEEYAGYVFGSSYFVEKELYDRS